MILNMIAIRSNLEPAVNAAASDGVEAAYCPIDKHPAPARPSPPPNAPLGSPMMDIQELENALALLIEDMEGDFGDSHEIYMQI